MGKDNLVERLQQYVAYLEKRAKDIEDSSIGDPIHTAHAINERNRYFDAKDRLYQLFPELKGAEPTE